MSQKGINLNGEFDPFSMVFDSFQASLSNKSERGAFLEEKLSNFMKKDLQKAASSRLQRVQQMRRLAMTRLATGLYQGEKKMDAVTSSHFEALTTAARHRNATE